MKKVQYIKQSVWAFFFILMACLEPYEPPEITEHRDLLVVDGFVDVTNQIARVTITHSAPLLEEAEVIPESLADVRIENDRGEVFPLLEDAPGIYVNRDLGLTQFQTKYRLSFTTSSDREYISDYIELRPTPPIDSITWQATDDGIEIYANTHDPSGNSKYYRWTSTETWEYKSPFESAYEISGPELLNRPPEESIHVCWKTQPSANISIGSGIQLREDIIRNALVASIPAGSEKLTVRYSIQVRQNVISEEEFRFWEQLKKTTENLGGLYDPLPSQVLGNLHNVNDDKEPVLGFFSGGWTDTERIFINILDLPEELQMEPSKEGCTLRSKSADFSKVLDSEYVIYPVYDGLVLVGVEVTTRRCADCREKGGTTIKPDFWE